MAPVKKAGLCDDKGWKVLKKRLLEKCESEITCKVCLKFLDEKNYQSDWDTKKCAAEPPAAKPSPPEADSEEPLPASSAGKAQPEQAGKESRKDRRERDRKEFKNDPWAFLKSFEPMIMPLPPGSLQKTLPFRCHACKTRRCPEGKIGDLVAPTFNSVHYFLLQHLESDAHMTKEAAYKGTPCAKPAVETVECEALCAASASVAGHLHKFRQEFEIWASMACFSKDQSLGDRWKHKYWKDSETDSWAVRSGNCLSRCTKVEGRDRQVCDECYKLGGAKSVIRSAQRFAMKYYMAQILHARLFQDQRDADTTVLKVKNSALYGVMKEKMDERMALDIPKLQQWVRTTVLCDNNRRDRRQGECEFTVYACICMYMHVYALIYIHVYIQYILYIYVCVCCIKDYQLMLRCVPGFSSDAVSVQGHTRAIWEGKCVNQFVGMLTGGQGCVLPFCRCQGIEDWINSFVIPCCRINVSTVPARMAELCHRFAVLIGSGEGSEEDMARLKVASAAVRGTYDSHPLILGLSLQCKRQCEKLERGLSSMAGRRSRESERERQLISDAGLSLAAACGNNHLARQFGLSSTALRTKVDDLKFHSLPVPCLALLWPEEVLRENFILLNTRFPMHQGGSKRS